jgi:hypothetical protein
VLSQPYDSVSPANPYVSTTLGAYGPAATSAGGDGSGIQTNFGQQTGSLNTGSGNAYLQASHTFSPANSSLNYISHTSFNPSDPAFQPVAIQGSLPPPPHTQFSPAPLHMPRASNSHAVKFTHPVSFLPGSHTHHTPLAPAPATASSFPPPFSQHEAHAAHFAQVHAPILPLPAVKHGGAYMGMGAHSSLSGLSFGHTPPVGNSLPARLPPPARAFAAFPPPGALLDTCERERDRDTRRRRRSRSRSRSHRRSRSRSRSRSEEKSRDRDRSRKHRSKRSGRSSRRL